MILRHVPNLPMWKNRPFPIEHAVIANFIFLPKKEKNVGHVCYLRALFIPPAIVRTGRQRDRQWAMSNRLSLRAERNKAMAISKYPISALDKKEENEKMFLYFFSMQHDFYSWTPVLPIKTHYKAC